MHRITFFILLFCTATLSMASAQDASVNWMDFERLDQSLSQKPKKSFIVFYTEWCKYCKQMDKKVYTHPKVIEVLNNEYYAVRFDAESKEPIHFDGQVLVNDQVDKSRRPLHQLAQLLAMSNNNFVAPTILILDENFKVQKRFFEFLSAKRLLKELEN